MRDVDVLKTLFYRRHTGQYLHYLSNYTNTVNEEMESLNRIDDDLVTNGYSQSIISKCKI